MEMARLVRGPRGDADSGGPDDDPGGDVKVGADASVFPTAHPGDTIVDDGPDAAAGMGPAPRYRQSLVAAPSFEEEDDSAAGGITMRARSGRNTDDDDKGMHQDAELAQKSSIDHASWDDGSEENTFSDEEGEEGSGRFGHVRGDPSKGQANSLLDRNDSLGDESMIRYLLCGKNQKLRRRANMAAGGGGEDDSLTTPPSQLTALRWMLSRARQLGVGKMKFGDASLDMYAPSGPSVAGAAVDLCLPVLFNFHMFVVLSHNRQGPSASVDKDPSRSSGDVEPPAGMNPKILPLIFLLVLFMRAIFPLKGRRRFWDTVKYTLLPPLYHVYFRDAFIGDVLTSLVRPIMDLAYCIFYFFISFYMIASINHDLDDAGELLRGSWILHNIVLPAVAILPLWWKFLQTLRQAWDSGQRWPHLGNSFKYLSAAQIILYAMGHREGKRSRWWLTAFFLAVLYQIWWDTVMDWELLVITPRDGSKEGRLGQPGDSMTSAAAEAKAAGPEPCPRVTVARVLLYLHRLVVLPILDRWGQISRYVSSHKVTLRPRRLYQRDVFYWRVFCYNAALRFVWMLSFIPAYHLDSRGMEVRTLKLDYKTYVGAVLSVAEIIRRCLWGIIKLELETIQVTDYSPVSTEEGYSPRVMLATMEERFGGKPRGRGTDVLSALRFESQSLMVQSAAMGKSGCRKGKEGALCNCGDAFCTTVFLAELILWAVAFVGLGIVSVWVL